MCYLVSKGEPKALVELESLLKVELVGMLELVAQAGCTLSYSLQVIQYKHQLEGKFTAKLNVPSTLAYKDTRLELAESGLLLLERSGLG